MNLDTGASVCRVDTSLSSWFVTTVTTGDSLVGFFFSSLTWRWRYCLLHGFSVARSASVIDRPRFTTFLQQEKVCTRVCERKRERASQPFYNRRKYVWKCVRVKAGATYKVNCIRCRVFTFESGIGLWHVLWNEQILSGKNLLTSWRISKFEYTSWKIS